MAPRNEGTRAATLSWAESECGSRIADRCHAASSTPPGRSARQVQPPVPIPPAVAPGWRPTTPTRLSPLAGWRSTNARRYAASAARQPLQRYSPARIADSCRDREMTNNGVNIPAFATPTQWPSSSWNCCGSAPLKSAAGGAHSLAFPIGRISTLVSVSIRLRLRER